MKELFQVLSLSLPFNYILQTPVQREDWQRATSIREISLRNFSEEKSISLCIFYL